jgi:deoxyguanosine kinase
MFFLLSRYRQQNNAVPQLLQSGRHLISDYTFAKDSLFARINMKGDELEMYYKLHEALAEKIPMPNLMVYLRADSATLMRRIAMRDRPYERTMEQKYIQDLNDAYDDFFLNQYHSMPILVIDSNAIDFVLNPGDLSWIESRIRQILQLPPYQPELPL